TLRRAPIFLVTSVDILSVFIYLYIVWFFRANLLKLKLAGYHPIWKSVLSYTVFLFLGNLFIQIKKNIKSIFILQKYDVTVMKSMNILYGVKHATSEKKHQNLC
ncbi:hypothetical protein, partial [Tolypothrix sp. FACHB-123]|uniref:hypothetical protein n=1 Tax=Tolypothrix sp. FACHB-123 TaxID=2692868 RepID=UPI001A7E738B